MVLFFDARNYSTAYTKYFGTTIPDGQVNITGLVQLFGSTSELLPMDIQPYTAPTPTGQVFWKPGAGVGGTGNWNNSSSNWNTAANGSGTQQSFTTTSYAAFGGTAGTVTISSPVTSNGVEFDTSGYVVTGGNLTLGSYGPGDTTNNRNTISVANAGDTATINAPIQGSSGLQKTGLGTLILGSTDIANNNFTGGVKVSSGTLQISSDANLGDSGNFVKLSGGTLEFNEGGERNIGKQSWFARRRRFG